MGARCYDDSSWNSKSTQIAFSCFQNAINPPSKPAYRYFILILILAFRTAVGLWRKLPLDISNSAKVFRSPWLHPYARNAQLYYHFCAANDCSSKAVSNCSYYQNIISFFRAICRVCAVIDKPVVLASYLERTNNFCVEPFHAKPCNVLRWYLTTRNKVLHAP